MRSIVPFHPWPSLLAGLVLAACGTPVPTPPPGPDGGAEARCESNTDCGGGQICRANLCRNACEASRDCDSALPVCDTTAGYCVQCNEDAECGRDEACVDHACEFFCRTDAACAADEYCLTDTGACATRECEATADCRGGFRCEGFVCVPIDDIVCEAGTEMCSGGNTAVLTCNADGTMQTTEACASGSTCVVDGTMAACRAVVCTAGEMGCTNDQTRYACDATGTTRTETACAAGEYCGGGACLPQTCTPGSARCSATGAREVCDARGAAFEAMPCAAGQGCRDGMCLDRICTPGVARCVPGSLTGHEVCDAEGLAYVSTPCAASESCSAGACLPRVCAPGVPSCDGTTGSRLCNADGLGYGPTMGCGSGSSCQAGTGMCSGWVCTPGTTSCVAGSNSRRVCNADGLGYTDTACGASTTCSAGICAPWSCTPGSASCADVNSRRVCNADGLGYSSSSCTGPAGYGYACLGAGACTERVCIPGSNGPVCASTTARQVCNADGQGYSTVSCGGSESCSGGTCQTRICTPGTARCVSGSLTGREVCAADGLSWAAAACADTQSCSGSGVCSTRVCAPGAPMCVGSTGTRTCNADGLGYSGTSACPSGTSCNATTGLCGAWICTPGSASCLSTGTRRVCNADGLGYTDTACGASTTCSAGVCAPWTCTPGAFSCLDTNTRRVCNADGLAYSSATCSGPAAYGYACTGAGACTDRVCSPGSASLVCASTTARQLCNTDGLGYSATSCASGQSCSTGTCAVRCGDGIVGTGEACDDGNTVSGDGCSSTCASECGAPGYASTVASLGATSYWSLSDSGSTFVDSIGGRNGSAVGTVSAGSTSLLPGAASVNFTGSGHISVPSTSVWHASTFSVAAWVQPTSFGSGESTVISTRSDLNAEGWYLYLRADRLWQFQIGRGGASWTYATGTTPATAGTTYFVVATFDGSTMRVYIDGTLQFSQASGGTLVTNPANALLIGNSAIDYRSEASMLGREQGVAFFTRALSATDVSALYRSGTCAVRCGDGIVGPGEACDDGNTVSGDGCSSVCQQESACTDGSTEQGSAYWGRTDIAFCATSTGLLPADTTAARNMCALGWHLCSRSEFTARNNSCPPHAYRFSAILDDGADCMVHDSGDAAPDGWICSFDGVRAGYAGSCTGPTAAAGFAMAARAQNASGPAPHGSLCCL